MRNLGAGSIRRPAWDHSIPGGCQVTAPTDLTPPPDNPLLEEFFQRDSEMHNTLFFRFGEKDEEFLPFNERVRDAQVVLKGFFVIRRGLRGGGIIIISDPVLKSEKTRNYISFLRCLLMPHHFVSEARCSCENAMFSHRAAVLSP